MAQTADRKTITAELARQMVDAAAKKAEELGVPSAITVVDESGVLKSFLRMDGAPLLSIQISQDKAYSAAGFGLGTHQWHDFASSDPVLAWSIPTAIDRLVAFGGGYPINVGGAIVGGIGASGGHYTQDMEIAEAGMAVVSS